LRQQFRGTPRVLGGSDLTVVVLGLDNQVGQRSRR
jgi:hypothetical protein